MDNSVQNSRNLPPNSVVIPKLIAAVLVEYYKLTGKQQQWGNLNHSLVVIPPADSCKHTQLVKYSEKLAVDRFNEPWKYSWADSYKQNLHAVLIKGLSRNLHYQDSFLKQNLDEEECLELIYEGPERDTFVNYPVSSDILGFEPLPGPEKYTIEEIAKHIANYVYTGEFPEIPGCPSKSYNNERFSQAMTKLHQQLTNNGNY